MKKAKKGEIPGISLIAAAVRPFTFDGLRIGFQKDNCFLGAKRKSRRFPGVQYLKGGNMQYYARLVSCLLAGLILGLGGLAGPLATHAIAQDKSFSHQGVAADAKRYETFLKANWKSDGKKPADLKIEAEKIYATDARASARLLANVVAAEPKDGAAWVRLAEALLAIKADPEKGSER